MLLAINRPHVGLSPTPTVVTPTVTMPANVQVEVAPYVPPDHLNRWHPSEPIPRTTLHLYEEDHVLLANVVVETVQYDWAGLFEEAEPLIPDSE